MNLEAMEIKGDTAFLKATSSLEIRSFDVITRTLIGGMWQSFLKTSKWLGLRKKVEHFCFQVKT